MPVKDTKGISNISISGPPAQETVLPSISGQKSTSAAKAIDKKNLSDTPKKEKHKDEKMSNGKKNKKGAKSKVSDEVFNEYVDNLQPARPFVEPFNFKKKQNETQKQFNQRVDNCAQRALAKSKIDDHFDVSTICQPFWGEFV